MAKVIKITLPIYILHKGRYLLFGINHYERMHHQPLNKIKAEYYQLINILTRKQPKIKGQYVAHFRYFYKNPASDAPNVVAVIDKVLMDGLQKCRKLENDNSKFYVASSWEVAGQDKKNPRIEIIIKEVESE